MPYLIAKIVDATDTSREVASLATRHALAEPSASAIRNLIDRDGTYEMGSLIGRHAVDQWPLTALVYTSRDKAGTSRCGSSLQRVPVRTR